MTTAESSTTAGSRTRATGPRGFIAGETEARPGLLTSEFMLTILTAATLVIAGYISEAFPVRLAWTLFAAVIVAYVLSRGIAKAGSKEGPFIGQMGGRDRG